MRDLGPAILITLLAHLITKPLWLIVENIIQDRLGHDVYGLIGALSSLSLWANVGADWGLSYIIMRRLAQGHEDNSEIYQHSLFLKVLLSFGSLVSFWLIGYAMGYRDQALVWLGWLLVYQVALAGIQYLRAFFQGHQAFRTDALLGNLEKAFILLLLFGFWNKIDGGLYVMLLAGGGLMTLAITLYWQGYRHGWLTLRAQLSPALRLLRLTTPYALVILTAGINERLNPIFLERLASAHTNSLYLGAYRWLGASMMYLWIVLPVFYARFARIGSDGSGLASTFLFGQLLSAMPLLAVALVMLVEPELFLILFRHSKPEEIANMARNLQILSFCAALNSVFNIYSTYLTANGHEKSIGYIQAVAVIVNIVLCTLLIPSWQSNGAAMALAASYAVFSVASYILFRRTLPSLDIDRSLPWRLLGSWFGLGIGLLLLRQAMPSLSLGMWTGLALFSYGLYAWISGLLKILWQNVRSH